jgi:transposase
MEVIHQHCAGLDVHQKTVVACARLATTAPVTHELRTFGTSTPELFALAEWLRTRGVTHVAMESTGVYKIRLANRLLRRLHDLGLNVEIRPAA